MNDLERLEPPPTAGTAKARRASSGPIRAAALAITDTALYPTESTKARTEPEARLAEPASSSGDLRGVQLRLGRYAQHIHIERVHPVQLREMCHVEPVRHSQRRRGQSRIEPGYPEARHRSFLMCRSHHAATVVASAETARVVRQCGALRTRLRTTTTAVIAETSAFRRATLDTTDTTSVLTRDKVPVVAINAIVSHAVVGGAAAAVVHVTLGRPAEILRTVEARDVAAAAVQVAQLGSGQVNVLAVTRGAVVGLLEHGQKRRIHHTRPDVAHCRGECVDGGTAIGAGRAESRTAGEARKVGALWTG